MKKKRKTIDPNDAFEKRDDVMSDINSRIECLSPDVEMDSHELLRQSMNDPIAKVVKKSSRKAKKNAALYSCHLCEEKCSSRRKLNKHILTHGPKPYTCDRCPLKFKCRKYLTRHITNTHVKKKQIKCDVCGKMFLWQSKLRNHMRTHTGEKPYKCKVCDKSFTALYSLQSHTYLHTDEKPYKCAFCEYACCDNSTLRKHQHRHMGLQVDYQCQICQKKMKSKIRLNEHMSLHNGSGEAVEERRYTCDLCGKSFTVKNNLAKHIRTIHDKITTTVECHICGKRISNAGNLKLHLRTHTDLRPYRCAFGGCGKRYKDKSSLSKHSILHSNVRFSCEECGRAFSRQERLRRHRVVVHGRRRGARCGQCGDRFYSNNYLSRHMHRKHSAAALMECDSCGLVTTNKPALVRHIHSRHTDQGRRCKLCGAVVPRRRDLRAHYWDQHAVRLKTKSRTKVRLELPSELMIKEEVLSEPEAELDLLDIDKHEIEDAYREYRNMAAAALQQASFPSTLDPTEGEPPSEDALIQDILEKGAPGKYAAIEGTSEEHAPENDFHREEDFSEHFPAEDNHIEDAAEKYASENDAPEKDVSEKDVTETDVPEKDVTETDVPEKDVTETDVPEKDVTETDVPGGDAAEEDAPQKVLERLFTQHVQTKNGEKVKLNGCVDIHAEELCKEEIVKLLGQATGAHLEVTTKLMSTRRNLVKIDPETLKNIVVTNRKSTQNNKELNTKVTKMKTIVKNTVSKSENKIVANDNAVANIVKDKKTSGVKHKDEISKRKKIKDNNKKEKSKVKKKKTDKKERSERKETVSKVKNGAKFLLDVQQCYVCFKLFKTKEELTKHCQEHFDLCSEKMLKKCPFCEYVTKHNLARHVKLIHKVNIKVKYGKILDKKKCSDGSRYTMAVEGDNVQEIEVIPSINNLNKMAGMKLDEANRNKKDKSIAKQKLVRRGNEWMFEQESIEDVFEMPKFTDNNLKAAGVNDSDNYIQKLRKLYQFNKKNGVAMLFPCDSCGKVCQAMSGLILHRRRHDPNKKPFRKKIWKHKLTKQELDELEKRKNKPTVVVKCNAKPKPIVNKHKCDPKLKDFYLNNIRGGDIEFWQFLKIFNKMGRENVNDFQDLESRHDFGIHPTIRDDTYSNTEHNVGSTSSTTNETSLKCHTNNKLIKKKLGLKFKRVLRLTTQEQRQREVVRKALRAKIREQSLVN